MKNIDSVIFDLDGTLWDTCASCAVAWNNVLKRREISFREITDHDVRKVTGLPHEQCIRETFVGLSEEQLQFLIQDTMEEDNRMVEKLGGHLYDGVDAGLRKLQKRFPLFIVSNCQTGYIETFLRFSGLEDVFDDFECWGKTGRPKGENLASLMARNNLKSPVYVGDAEGDRVAARFCKVPFYFAEYGFGQVQDRDYSFAGFPELVGHLLD